jgi:hypothetical protein
VLTLCGVLKDILLVMASMAIFGDPVAPLQYFGYSIALGGLMYYRLGGEKLKQLGMDTRLAVGSFQRDSPAAAKALTILGALAVVCWVLWGCGFI